MIRRIWNRNEYFMVRSLVTLKIKLMPEKMSEIELIYYCLAILCPDCVVFIKFKPSKYYSDEVKF